MAGDNKKPRKPRFTPLDTKPGDSKRPQGPASTPDEIERAMTLVRDIAEMIDNDVPDLKYAKNTEYFENVTEKSKAIGETISRSQRVTDGQLTALENMLEGVRKWTD